MDARLESIVVDPKIVKKQKINDGYRAFLRPLKPTQKLKKPRKASGEASPLTLYSDSSIPGGCSSAMETPGECSSGKFENNLSHCTHEYAFIWAPAGTPGKHLLNNCFDYINEKIRNILVEKYGIRKFELIMQEQTNMIEAVNNNYFAPIKLTIDIYIDADHDIHRELKPSLLALDKMQSVKDTIDEWTVATKVDEFLDDCNDFDEIEDRSYDLDVLTDGLCDNFFQLISTVGNEEKDVTDILDVYGCRVHSLIQKGKHLLQEKKPRYGNSGRFVYQYIADNLKTICSVHPCNFQRSKYDKYYSRFNI